MPNERIDIVVSDRGSRTVKRNLTDIGNAAERSSKLMDGLRRAVLGIGAVLSLTTATNSAIKFQSAIAEVSTLVNTATFDMQRLTEAALDNATAFGQAPVQQAQAFYQIISAGASTAAEAQETLTAANRLAVGGVTDVATAADGLTSVLNAYGNEVKSAADVSDILFVGVRAGKTTIDELSNSIGRVAPLAASAGVSFEELTSAIAALTKGGISTNEAVTGTRGVLAAIVKPTEEAKEAAERLGIQFNSTALEAQGLKGFLDTVVDATGGSTTQLAKLFGGVEALVPVLALAGQAGIDFTETLEQMGDRAGVTEEAFNKIANSPGFQIQRILNGINAEATETASIFTQALVPAFRFVADNMEILADIVRVVAIAIGIELALVAIPAAISALAALTAALFANPFTAIVAGISLAIGALITFGDRLKLTGDGAAMVLDFLQVLFRRFGNFVASTFSILTNFFSQFQGILDGVDFLAIATRAAQAIDVMIGIFEAGFDAVKALVGDFPRILGASDRDWEL